MSEHFGEEHNSIAEILKNMAACYEKQGLHELALDTCALAHRIGVEWEEEKEGDRVEEEEGVDEPQEEERNGN